MNKDQLSREEMIARINSLEDQLQESEQTLHAIRSGEVDALIIYEPMGERLYTLKGADRGYRTLVESISEGALILSSDDSIYYCNCSFGNMLKVPIQKIIGTTVDSYVVRDSRPEVMRLIQRSRDHGKAEGEFQILQSSGNLLPVKLSLNSVVLEDFDGICAIVTDLSVAKKREQELRNASEKLRQVNKELQDFAFIASHDLQEPLRKIQAFGDRLNKSASNKLSDSEKDFLARMQNAANRMSKFIQDLLRYSRLATEAQPLGKVGLREVVEEALADLDLVIESAGATVDIYDLPTVVGEKYQLRQLFQNLISNSLKFRGEEEPRIKIFSKINGNDYQIYIEDNGIGFDEVYLDRIFVPFQRLHGRGRYEGTGMGLAICRKIAERHGGSITARSVPGKGSSFIINLPINMKSVSTE